MILIASNKEALYQKKVLFGEIEEDKKMSGQQKKTCDKCLEEGLAGKEQSKLNWTKKVNDWNSVINRQLMPSFLFIYLFHKIKK